MMMDEQFVTKLPWRNKSSSCPVLRLIWKNENKKAKQKQKKSNV